jgi:rSAM/selenodomain-associated transferase 2
MFKGQHCNSAERGHGRGPMKSADSAWMKILCRVLCAAVSAAGLWLALHKQPLGKLWATLLRTDPALLILGVALLGLTLLCSALRWHLFLQMTGCASHFGATGRTTLVSHVFSVFLFGPLGADVGRATLYSRWYREPIPRVLLSMSLDRLVTMVGWGTFVGFGMVIAVAKGFVPLGQIARFANPAWIAPGLVLCAMGGWLAVRQIQRSGSIVGRAGRPFLEGLRQLAAQPRVTFDGWLLTLAGQVVLIAMSVLFLQAVSVEPIPWWRILWVFPVVMFLGTLPVSAAGLGVRESASMVMLGLYHIPSETAVAASLLMFLAFLIWTIPGALILARHERERKRGARPKPETISVVIPTWNEEKELPETLARLSRVAEVVEIIVVDGGSSDATRAVAERAGRRVLSAPRGRGVQMRAGAEQATGNVILFLHADTWLPPHAGKAILAALRDEGVVAGGFWKVFRERRWLLRGSRFKCASRLYLGGLILGDQGFFVLREELAAAGGVPETPIMEEFELCRRLRKRGRLALADAVATTSARRFVERGVLRTYARMWRLALGHQLGKAKRVVGE